MLQDARKTRQCAFAPGTSSNLKTQWKAYFLFCLFYKRKPVPASETDVCCYVEFLRRSFVSFQSVRNYLNGVKLLHAQFDEPFPEYASLSLRLTLKGAAKLMFREPNRAPPVTPSLLKQLRRTVDVSNPFEVTFFCCALFAFFALARKSSLIPKRSDCFDPILLPTRGDVRLTSFGLVLKLKASKCNQFGARCREIPLFRSTGSEICPVDWFRRMCTLVPTRGRCQPLFTVGTCRSFDFDLFSKYLKLFLSRNNLPVSNFTGHSFRRGGATAAFRAGLPGELIQYLGGWSSDCYKIYLQHDVSSSAGFVEAFSKWAHLQV